MVISLLPASCHIIVANACIEVYGTVSISYPVSQLRVITAGCDLILNLLLAQAQQVRDHTRSLVAHGIAQFFPWGEPRFKSPLPHFPTCKHKERERERESVGSQ